MTRLIVDDSEQIVSLREQRETIDDEVMDDEENEYFNEDDVFATGHHDDGLACVEVPEQEYEELSGAIEAQLQLL